MEIQGTSIHITRDSNGVPKVTSETEEELFFGMGYCHAMDRGIQMMLMKTLGKGEACLRLQDSDEMFIVDRFFRQYNFRGRLSDEIQKFSDEELGKLKAYCNGVNQRFSEKQPWELKVLLGFKEFEWKVEDILMMSRMAGFLTLAQSQAEAEQLFIELVQNGVSRELLEELFPGILGDYDEAILKKINLPHYFIPKEVKWNNLLNPVMASNNWVIGSTRSKSGKPILANDPHLEINRLPAVWYEIILETKNSKAMGATMPGISALLIGRNKSVSWGATYTFMDSIDHWIEKCVDGKYLKDDQWHDFKKREEIIQRKKKGAQTVVFYENKHGVLLGDPNESGYYLSVKWSGEGGGAISIQQGLSLNSVTTVEEGMERLGKLEMSFNWVLADVHGNIGYQMSGLLPKRHPDHLGFTPIPGWKSDYDWQGFHNHRELPRILNPDNNYIITANENLSEFGEVNPHTITMGRYRSDRIRQLIETKETLSAEDMKEMHMDVYSLQAEKFMKLIGPMLPQGQKADQLNSWDYKYDPESVGATIFENIYAALVDEVFGGVMGEQVTEHLRSETGYIADFYDNFDRILLSEHSLWFGDRSRDEIFKKATETGLLKEAKPWGQVNQIVMANILVGGKFPKFFGFDVGPIPLCGNRATIHQGQIYQSNGRTTSFAPSYRIIADMAREYLETALPGGVSDRRFSKLYKSDLDNWICGNYKKLES